MERLASASLTSAERKLLIRLLKKIGYQAAAISKWERKDQAEEATHKLSKGRK